MTLTKYIDRKDNQNQKKNSFIQIIYLLVYLNTIKMFIVTEKRQTFNNKKTHFDGLKKEHIF